MLKLIFGNVLVVIMLCAVAYGQATQPAGPQADVPVKAVVLFSSGVGYFEHFGSVRGDGSTELRFKTGQINDILKSLVLQDLDGGKVSTVTYPSQDPIAKTLRSFQVDITNNPPLADLLNQLRGAKVTLQAQTEKLTGTILGVERKQKPVGDKGTPIEVPVLNLLAGTTIRSIELDQVSSLSLDDPQLQEELNKALVALTQARDQDKKPVVIGFAGQGERRVRIGYVVETPIWKTSYRLILDGKVGKLQGWAIVENQTDGDWNNVQLSLVSGRPISFVMDLYQPLYIPRPVIVPELYASLRPQRYEQGMEEGKVPEAFAANAPRQMQSQTAANSELRDQLQARREALGGRGGGDANAPQFQLRATAGFIDPTASVSTVASATNIGELFQYTVGNVTLARQKSAMLPIVTSDVEVERLSIYNASVLPKNPLNGARLKNTTKDHLLQGPITVIDANSYAGDARIDDLPPGQERLLSYGIDLQMLVDSTKNTQEDAILTGKIVKGVLDISRKHVATQDYLAENKSDQEKTLIIEHPIREGWKLVSTEKPIETTPTVYRFKGSVGPKKSSKLTAKEEITDSETIAILPTDTDTLTMYSRTGEIPKNVRDALARAVQLKQAVVDTERQIGAHTQQLAEITQEQARIRANMGTAMNTAGAQGQYYQRLLTKMNDQESQIEKLQSERDELTKKRDGQRKELEDYVGNLNVG